MNKELEYPTQPAIQNRRSAALSLVLRLLFCAAATLLNGIDLGLQGNGNLVPSGLFLGLILSAAWSGLLLFGLPRLTQYFYPKAKLAVVIVFWIAAVALLVIVCFQIWKGR